MIKPPFPYFKEMQQRTIGTSAKNVEDCNLMLLLLCRLPKIEMYAFMGLLHTLASLGCNKCVDQFVHNHSVKMKELL